MQIYGELLVGLALPLTLIFAGLAFVGARFRKAGLVDAARLGTYGLACLFWALALLLSYAFITHDFTNKYVSTYSDRGMPIFYLLASFWGGEKGALLFWVTSLTTFSAISIHSNRRKNLSWIGCSLGVLLLCISFFVLLMVFESNPFATFLTFGGPADGQGLNPLLQNPVMTIHPPSLLTGYITFSIPFAYGIGALMTGKLDTEWIQVTRFWTIVSWLFLSLGLILGGAWAYQELGWGGYWMWDPVENAGLIPWFTSTAFLHSVMIQERRGMLRRWNAVLVCVTFLLTIFGTFLTRSQLIVSIHAFADSTLSDYFLGLMIFLVLVSAGLIAWRWNELRSEHNIESFWSRESFFVLNNVLLVSCAFIVLWGTLFPKISELQGFRQGFNSLVLAFNGSLGILFGPLDTLNQAVDLGEPWFNRVMAPLGLGLVFLTGAGPIIAWRRATKTNFRKNFVQPLLWSVIPTLATSLWVARQHVLTLQYQGADVDAAWTTVFSALGATESYITLSFYFCFFSLFSILLEFYRGADIRQKKFGGSHLWNSLVLTLKARRRFGGYIVHIGIILCFLAFTGNAFKEEVSEQVLHVGDYLERGEYRVTLARLDDTFEEDGRYVASQALLMVNERGDPINAAGQQALAQTLESHGLTPARVTSRPGHANTQVQLQSEDAYQKLLAVGLVSTLSQNFLRLPDATDEPARIYRFRNEPVLKIKPMAFMRYVRDLKTRFSEIPILGAQADFTPGSTVLRIRFDSDEAMEAFEDVEALASALPEILNIRASPQPQTADLILASSGRILVPEVRFYEKHSTPTTEIAIESHLLEDLYLAMRPATGKPYISLYAVVAPLVSFLWLGALLLLFGAFIAVLPDWAVAFIPSSPRREDPRRPAPRGPSALLASTPSSWIAILACGALFSMVMVMEVARAQKTGADSRGPSPSPLAPITTRLSCPERVSGGWTVHNSRSLDDCPTAEGQYMRELVQHLHESGGPFDLSRKQDRSQLLQALVREDPRADRLLKVPVRSFTNIWHHTKCLCGCSHILFQCGMECGPGKDWKETMRQQFAAGFTEDEVLQGYMAYWNARLPPAAKPYNRESILKDPGQEGTWALPLIGGCAVLFGFIFAIRRRQRSPRAEPLSSPSPAPPETLSGTEDSLIDDLLDESGGPLS